MADRVPMTQRGYEQLKSDLEQLKRVDRPQNIKEIEEAIAHGDLSENAEYHAAKEKQSHIAGRIAQAEDILARAEVIAATATDRIQFGVTVRLEDVESGEEVCYAIVGEHESDVARGRISITSPVARALMGKQVDETVTVKVPKGTREFDILEISIEESIED